MRIPHQDERGTFAATHLGMVLVLVSFLTMLAACGGGGGGTAAPDGSGVPPAVSNDAGTITLHVNASGNAPTNEQLVTVGSSGETGRLSVLKDGAYLRVLVSDSTGQESSLGVSISDWQPAQTHTISFVWGDGVGRLYIDGQLAEQVDYSGVLELPPGTRTLSGSISDFQAFDRPLTPEEIAHLAGTTVATSTPPIFGTPAKPPPTSDVTLRVQSTSVAEPDGAGTVCVEMIGGTGFVAGTQNDLAWDLGCVEIGEPCQANPRHGKGVFTKLNPGPSLRTLVFSLTNTDPIDDGVLYCCPFHVASVPSGTCCPVRVQGAAASDSSGHLVLAGGVDGQICLR